MFLIKLAAALMLMAAVSSWMSDQIHWLAMKQTPLLRAGALFVLILVSATAYFGALAVMGFRPKDFRKTAKV
jgi:putative peptidoglycan lipid II flippase